MSRNALAALGTALLVLLALPANVAAKNPNGAINGVYRASFTEKELLAGGMKPGNARDNAGLWTLTFKDGRYRFLNVNQDHRWDCRGPYQLRGKRIFADLNVKDCHGTLRATWSLRNGWLRFSNLVVEDPGDPALWESKPWKKIG